MAMRLLYCGSGWLPVVDCIRTRLTEGDEISYWTRDEALEQVIAEVDILLPSNAPITHSVVKAAKNLKMIQQPAAGTDAISREAVREFGIPLCNAPGANAVAVAEATLFFMLALARKLPVAERRFEEGQIGIPLGVELRGKTVGIIGMGKIGKTLLPMVRALGMNVLSITSKSSKDDFHDLLRRSDFVSIHCPLNENTTGFINGEAFAMMKAGALLINGARGGIIDRDALVWALEHGNLGGVAPDSFWEEPWDPKDPLYARDDVVAMPHIAGSTDRALGAIADIVVENVRRLKTGEELLHRIA